MTRTHAPFTARAGEAMLFFDLEEIEETRNVVRSVCRAQKHPHNPVMLQGDKDRWDSGDASPWAARGVMYDPEDRLFKCWYNGSQMGQRVRGEVGYAVSEDGVVEYAASKRNNLVGLPPWVCLIKDPAEPNPERRYKAMTCRHISYSPDGIRWGKFTEMSVRLPKPCADPVVFVRDEQDPDPQRRYKFVYQYYDAPNKPGPDRVRFKGIAFSPDGFTWQGSPDVPMLGPNDGFEHENHFLMYIPYEGQYVVLYECGWYHPDETGKYGRYVADIRLAHSRDGEHFTRINPHETVIPKGEPNEWDGQFLVITDKAVIKDDVIYLYYAGMGTDWTSWPPTNAVPGDLSHDPESGKGGTGSYCLRRMGLATLRLDGFTCMRTPDALSFGQFTTKPIAWGAPRPSGLTVNVSRTRPGWSWVQVEVLDAQTRAPLPGLSREQCLPLSKDGLREPVRWAQARLGDVTAGAVRLRFHLYGGARLHAVRFV